MRSRDDVICQDSVPLSVCQTSVLTDIDTLSYSWVSRDVIISLGVNSKSMHSHRREIVFHCMC